MYASNVSIIVTSVGFEYFINFIYSFINYNFTNFTIFDLPKVMTTVVVEVIRIEYMGMGEIKIRTNNSEYITNHNKSESEVVSAISKLSHISA